MWGYRWREVIGVMSFAAAISGRKGIRDAWGARWMKSSRSMVAGLMTQSSGRKKWNVRGSRGNDERRAAFNVISPPPID